MSMKNKVQEHYQKLGIELPKYETFRCGGSDHIPHFKSKVTLMDNQIFEGKISNNKAKAEESAAETVLLWMESQPIHSVHSRMSLTSNASNIQTCPLFYTPCKKYPSNLERNLNIHQKESLMNSVNKIDVSRLSIDDSYENKSIDRKARHIGIEKALSTPINKNGNPKTLSTSRPLLTLNSRIVLLVDVENMPHFIDNVLEEIKGLTVYAFIGYHHNLCDKEFPPSVIKVLSPSTRTDGTDTCIQVHVGYFLANNMYHTYLIGTRDHFGSSLVDMITSESLLWKSKKASVVTKVHHIHKLYI